VSVTTADPDGNEQQVRARYVVGCDGLQSVVREHTGIGFTGDRYAQSDVAMALDRPQPSGAGAL
jgi:2-polyprenyl-6-methoxyphenol hydroxylase-like FAD-dependent oxidoreductase